ncbi:MAG: nitroreductase family protein [Candidatus Aegiribacteria sp.]|nr:nitroreductase family protein [Candidatus Aegiribacteria sp.]
MKFHDLAEANRSVRRFRENERIAEQQLLKFIDSARLAPCGANLQLLRFTPVTERKHCSRIFPLLKWAGYLEEWNGPEEGERPPAYIVIHAPIEERRHIPVDIGIAAAYVVLAARESGYGSCMIMSFDENLIEKAAGTPEGYHPFLVIAFGVPGEETVLEEADGGIRYYRDAKDRHHVPKLALYKLIVPVKD